MIEFLATRINHATGWKYSEFVIFSSHAAAQRWVDANEDVLGVEEISSMCINEKMYHNRYEEEL